jgi:RND family efflux transporter MFP subunit
MKIEQAKALRLEANINRDDEVRRAGRRLHAGWMAAVATIVFVAAGLWFANRNGAAPVPTQVTTAAQPAAEAAPPSGDFSAAGYIEPVPPFPVKITPLVSGRLDQFSIREGDEVKAGDIVARLNTDQHQNREAELVAAATVAARRLDFAEKELARAETLSSQGAMPKRELESASAEVGILRAEAERIKAELETVRWQIEQSAVRSPVDGVVYERLASEGDFIDLEERHGVASVIDPQRMQVWVDVSQRDLARIREGGRALVSLDSDPGREFRGRVDRILPKASLARNTVRVVLKLEEFPPSLRPEMSVKVVFPES